MPSTKHHDSPADDPFVPSLCHTRPSARPVAAFTLIELLIVVAIIALLVSIMLPALAQSRRVSQAGVCLANLQRLSVGAELYVSQYNTFPPFRLQKNPDGTTHVNQWGRAKPRWHWFVEEGVGPVIDPYGFPTPFDDNSRSADGRDGLTMTNNYFLDPALREPQFERDIRNGAYGYNYQYLGNTRTDHRPGVYDNWPVNPSRFLKTDALVAFADSRGGAEPHGNHSYSLDPPKKARSAHAMKFGPGGGAGEELQHSPAEARHPGGANVAFVDGHAEALTLRELGYHLDTRGRVVPDDPRGDNRLWTGMGHDEPQP